MSTYLKRFDARPDYVFSTDETDTILIWPDRDWKGDECLHTMQRMADGEIVEHAIYNNPMPADGDAYDEMIGSIVDAGWSYDISLWQEDTDDE